MVKMEKRPTDEALRQKIERRAYEIWKSKGCPHGLHVDHWLQAEAEIMASRNTIATPGIQKRSTHAEPKGKK